MCTSQIENTEGEKLPRIQFNNCGLQASFVSLCAVLFLGRLSSEPNRHRFAGHSETRTVQLWAGILRTVQNRTSINFKFTMAAQLANKEGHNVPDVVFKLIDGGKWSDVTTDSIFKGKTVVVFSLPGAFTPTCSSTHLPRFNELAPLFKKNGVDEIVCMSVNDTFVMNSWKASQEVSEMLFWQFIACLSHLTKNICLLTGDPHPPDS